MSKTEKKQQNTDTKIDKKYRLTKNKNTHRQIYIQKMRTNERPPRRACKYANNGERDS